MKQLAGIQENTSYEQREIAYTITTNHCVPILQNACILCVHYRSSDMIEFGTHRCYEEGKVSGGKDDKSERKIRGNVWPVPLLVMWLHWDTLAEAKLKREHGWVINSHVKLWFLFLTHDLISVNKKGLRLLYICQAYIWMRHRLNECLLRMPHIIAYHGGCSYSTISIELVE